MNIKELLFQHNDLEKEVEDIRKDIKNTEESIEKLLKDGTVIDKVSGGYGGIQGFKIEGMPEREYNRRRLLLRKKHDRLSEKENDLLENIEKIEEFIDAIPVSRDRRIIKAVFIQKKTQHEIAKELYVDRSLISKTISKYV